MNNRICYTIDLDPIYCEIAIRRLERFRQTGKTGWQNGNPFEKEILSDPELKSLIGEIPAVVEDNQLSLI
jgi:site-specific DNA-methyltransferase (adenine-specific)